jgi:FkbM family methyltransferase
VQGIRDKSRVLILSIISLPFRVTGFALVGLSHLINLFRKGLGTRALDDFHSSLNNQTMLVKHQTVKGEIFNGKFYTSNFISKWRVETFSTKEPETLQWIDEFGGEGSFFDIGANIGLYSIYYAATKHREVYAFEPSVLNTKLLAKNIYLNELSHLVKIVTTPLSDSNGFAKFKLSSTQEGGALSSFGVEYGQDGQTIQERLAYSTLGFSLDSLVKMGLLPDNPRLIKIDVDGIEDMILRGSGSVLNHPTCKSVLVEVTPKFGKNFFWITNYLEGMGYYLVNPSKKSNQDGYNQIWVRP